MCLSTCRKGILERPTDTSSPRIGLQRSQSSPSNGRRPRSCTRAIRASTEAPGKCSTPCRKDPSQQGKTRRTCTGSRTGRSSLSRKASSSNKHRCKQRLRPSRQPVSTLRQGRSTTALASAPHSEPTSHRPLPARTTSKWSERHCTPNRVCTGNRPNPECKTAGTRKQSPNCNQSRRGTLGSHRTRSPR